ncbi:nitroreductase family protein [Chloroflexota bacterium]
MGIYEVALSRRSIRRFKETTVPYPLLEKCVNVARLAPCGSNRQLCEHIIVDDPALVTKVSATIRSWAGQSGLTAEHYPKAYIIILVSNDLKAELGGNDRVINYDVAMAMENMLLVAQEEGVASCTLLSFKEDELRPLMKIPESHDIALVVALGYPDESPLLEAATDSVKTWVDEKGIRHVPKRKLEDILHYNKF